ncbi:MAG: glucose-6-phosphate dehydrogenase assembly protein OpcA [Chloroflexia bacterium]|nr:glucose-6-phosphate dehydrogenase assembly protein OpcA [Chloroflexia bacterium]
MVSRTEQTPVLATSFQADVVDTGLIHDELNRLWAELSGPPHGGGATGEMVAEPHFGGDGLMRANTLNLLAVARNERDAGLITASVSRLHDFLPSRTIILVTRPPAAHGDEDARPYDVHLQLIEQHTGTDAPPLRFETITITAGIHEMGHLSSLVSPLLAADLPDFLWWPGNDFVHNPLFEDLQQIVDRVIVDSAQLGNDTSGVAAMRKLLESNDTNSPHIGDFTWLRLAPWRQLIAQFFDPPDVQLCLTSIEEVTISYADVREDGSSGLASALLTVGWLASRLGWEIMDPLEKRRAGGWSAPLRASANGRGEEIALRLLPDKSPHARFSLRHVEITSGGDQPGTFRVERTDADDFVTSSETKTVPLVSRMVYAKRPTNENMLGEELQRFGRDRTFEEAITFATRLLP